VIDFERCNRDWDRSRWSVDRRSDCFKVTSRRVFEIAGSVVIFSINWYVWQTTVSSQESRLYLLPDRVNFDPSCLRGYTIPCTANVRSFQQLNECRTPEWSRAYVLAWPSHRRPVTGSCTWWVALPCAQSHVTRYRLLLWQAKGSFNDCFSLDTNNYSV